MKLPCINSRPAKIVLFTALALAPLGLIPLPLQIIDADKEAAVAHTIEAIVRNRCVLVPRSLQRLSSSGVSRDHLYFRNNLGIPDDVFLSHGLKPPPAEREFDPQSQIMVIEFTKETSFRAPNQLVFSIGGGSSTVGYRIRIHKSLLTRYFVYIHSWIACG